MTIFGETPPLQALRRSGAKPGDEIWVSGNLGDAALALAHQQGDIVLREAEFISCASHLHQPQPRVELGVMLRNIATSAIDISDGLLADLGHILESSNMGAIIDFSALPVSQAVGRYLGQPRALRCVLAGGDDYELCFTAPRERHAEILNIASKLDLMLTPIGKIISGRACTVIDESGNPIRLESCGYDHFR